MVKEKYKCFPSLDLESSFKLSMEPWAAAKRTSVSVVVPPGPVRVPNQRPLALNVASVTSVANDKGDNEVILGAVHRSPNEVGRIAQQIRNGEGREI